MSDLGKGRPLAPQPPHGGIPHQSSTSGSSPSLSDAVSSALPDGLPDSENSPEGLDSKNRQGGHERQGSASKGATSRRRRVPESVTQNACTNCKRARAKVIILLLDRVL